MRIIYPPAVALYFLSYCGIFFMAVAGLWLLFGTDIDLNKGLELGRGVRMPLPSQAIIIAAIVVACILAVPLLLVAMRSRPKLRAHYKHQLQLFRASKKVSLYVAWLFILLAHTATLYVFSLFIWGLEFDDSFLAEHSSTLTLATYLYAVGILIHEIGLRKWAQKQASAA